MFVFSLHLWPFVLGSIAISRMKSTDVNWINAVSNATDEDALDTRVEYRSHHIHSKNGHAMDP